MKKKALKNISIFGTSSDAGKSTVTFIVAKILQEAGYSVAPFKAQNVSNNAKVADDNSEIAIAQYFQAKEILHIPTSYHLNPILLKSGKGSSSSLIIEGKAIEQKDIREYYKDLDTLKPIVKRNFEYLDKRYDVVVAEGAGSPVELNLMDKDLSNIYIADEFDTKIILVADIQKGGVFASIYGVYHLLPPKLKSQVIGVIVNKFQGDMSLFDEGVRIIQEEFGLRVFGVLPYHSLDLGFEDSASLLNYRQNRANAKIKIAVIKYPTMSNYNDMEPLLADSELDVDFVSSDITLRGYDMVILPGSKLTIDDLRWLQESNIDKRILEYEGVIFGICGGYEKLCNSVGGYRALGLIDDKIEFVSDKILERKVYDIFGIKVSGFELHEGISTKGRLHYHQGRIYATFVHEVFDSNEFRNMIFKNINPNYRGYDFQKYKQNKISKFMEVMKGHLDERDIIMSLYCSPNE